MFTYLATVLNSLADIRLDTYLSGKRVAVKILPHDENHCAAESVSGERNAADLAHENVVRLHAVFDNVAGSSASSSVLVLDYAGKSNLQTIIRRHPEVMEREEFQVS